jgi:hypothetical protein
MSIYALNLPCCSQGGLDKTFLALVLVASEEEQDSNFRCEEESKATKSALIWCQYLFSRQKYIKSFKIKIKLHRCMLPIQMKSKTFHHATLIYWSLIYVHNKVRVSRGGVKGRQAGARAPARIFFFFFRGKTKVWINRY